MKSQSFYLPATLEMPANPRLSEGTALISSEAEKYQPWYSFTLITFVSAVTVGGSWQIGKKAAADIQKHNR
ncbi:MAG: hypothetical protein A1D16_10015 [Flavihumibacter sp. CACIAM 22H1]|nr:MAG: hypothetical protein A1D16_10015 [Flavihumibacter sp. CACIAM 22H1]